MRQADPTTLSTATATLGDRRRGPQVLTRWLGERSPSLAERWIDGIRQRGQIGGNGLGAVVECFAELLVQLLPPMLGPHREEIAPLWDRAAALFGAIAAKRGLAAGEAIEELHILRELVIRDLYRRPPADGRVRLSLREILRMNRALDRAVTHGSVGHTDALFFEFFESEGGSALLAGGPDVAEEAREQLEQIRDEVRLILEHSAPAQERDRV